MILTRPKASPPVRQTSDRIEKASPARPRKGANPSDVEIDCKISVITRAGLYAPKPGPVAFQAADEIPPVASCGQVVPRLCRQFLLCRFATNVGGAVRIEACPMIGDTSKDAASVAAFPAQQWSGCVDWGLYRQGEVGCMRCRQATQAPTLSPGGTFSWRSSSLVRIVGRLAILNVCVASSDCMTERLISGRLRH